MGNINVLYRFSDTKILLLSDDCSIFLLPKTQSRDPYRAIGGRSSLWVDSHWCTIIQHHNHRAPVEFG
uniref:Tpk1 n=1 Tax=Arundo donax TaxID=35708 RepID=A0A0A9D0R6_ARUDO